MEACIRVLRLLGSCQRHYLLKGNLGELHRYRPVCSLERVTMTLIHLKAKRLHQYRADDLELAFMSILLQRHPSHQTRCGVAVNMLRLGLPHVNVLSKVIQYFLYLNS